MKAFLFTHSNLFAPEDVRHALSNTTAVATWVSPFPYSAILLSDLAVSELTAVLQVHFPEMWFVLVELNSQNCNGFLPVQLWEYVSNPFGAWSKKFFANLSPTIPEPPKSQLPQPPLELLSPPKKAG